MTERLVREIGASGVELHDNVAKVSIVGAGMRSHAGVASKMFKLLADQGINIHCITTSEIRVSCLIEKERPRQRAGSALRSAGLSARSRSLRGSTVGRCCRAIWGERSPRSRPATVVVVVVVVVVTCAWCLASAPDPTSYASLPVTQRASSMVVLLGFYSFCAGC